MLKYEQAMTFTRASADHLIQDLGTGTILMLQTQTEAKSKLCVVMITKHPYTISFSSGINYWCFLGLMILFFCFFFHITCPDIISHMLS